MVINFQFVLIFTYKNFFGMIFLTSCPKYKLCILYIKCIPDIWKLYFFYTRCRHGYAGEKCEKLVPEECLTHCLNQGQCSHCDKTGTTPVCQQCQCHTNYGGNRCEKHMPGATGTGRETSTVIAIVIPAILCILIVLVILGICIYRRRGK